MRLNKRLKLHSLFLLLCGSIVMNTQFLQGTENEPRVIKKIIITGSKRFPT